MILVIKKEKIAQGLAQLKERTIKYDSLQEQLKNTAGKQISTTDTDSRSLPVTKAIVEVACNTQNAVDDKHNLIVHTEATDTNDGQALHQAATQAIQNWTPDYTKVAGALKNGFRKAIDRPSKPFAFFKLYSTAFSKAA